jgi:hypothetical protein
MIRKIRFKAKKIVNQELVFGAYIDSSCSIFEDNGLRHPVHKNTVEEFTGFGDSNGKPVYSGDILYSIDTDQSFKYVWDESKAGYRAEHTYPCDPLINFTGNKITNFSLIQKELMTKKEFLDKFFNNSFYYIANHDMSVQLQAIAISLGFRLNTGLIDIAYLSVPKNLAMLIPDKNHDYNFFQTISFYSKDFFGEVCDFKEMVEQHGRLYHG